MKTVTNKFSLYLTTLIVLVCFNVSFSQDELSNLSLDELLNIEVTTASKSSEKISDAAGVISVVTKDELERFGGITLREILERVPSLNSASVYMTDRTVIAARGDQVMPSSSHILLLINGRPVRETLEGGIKSEMYESFPVNIIERIEVIRGPGSVLYGSNAFSGVINIITKQGEENNLSVTGLTGGTDTYNVLADLQYNFGDFKVVAGGRIAKKQDWKMNWQADPEIIPGNDTFGGDISVPDEGAGMFAQMSYKNLRAMFSYNEWLNYHFVSDYAFLEPLMGNVFWKKLFGDIGYSFSVTDKWDMDFNATYSRSGLIVSHWPNSNRDSYEIIGEWANSYRASDDLKLTFGGLYNYMKGREEDQSIQTNLSDGSNSTVSGYAQVDYRAADWVKLIGGIQANKVQDLDLDINPRVGAILYPYDFLNVKVLYSQAFRAPSLNELTLDFAQMMGNPNLKPEKVNTLDIGLNYTGVNGTAGINYFYSKMTNIIYQDRSGKYPVPTYDNIGEVSIQGFEAEGKYYFNKELFFTGSLLYQTNEDQTGTENVTPIANFGLKAGLSYMDDNGLTLSLFNVYQGEPDDKYKSTLNVSPEAYNMLNFYGKYDINRLIGLPVKELAVVLNVQNLLDKEIWLPNWGVSPGASIPVYKGRIVYAGLNLSL